MVKKEKLEWKPDEWLTTSNFRILNRKSSHLGTTSIQ